MVRCCNSRGDILAILAAVTALDVSVAHPAVAGTSSSGRTRLRACAATAGAAAAHRDEDKRKKYRDNACAEAFTPLSHETWGRLGKPAMQLLSVLGDAVAAGGHSSKAAFVRGALAELSVALCRGNERVFRMYSFNFARVSGSAFVAGDMMPTAELG